MQMYQSSLGLTVGMHLTTERGGPYRVLGITAPYYFKLGFDTLVIYHQPVVTVEIAYLDDARGHTPTISPLGRDPDGTYWSEQNDQIWISAGDSVQLDMFRVEPPDAEPYAFQAGVKFHFCRDMISDLPRQSPMALECGEARLLTRCPAQYGRRFLGWIVVSFVSIKSAPERQQMN